MSTSLLIIPDELVGLFLWTTCCMRGLAVSGRKAPFRAGQLESPVRFPTCLLLVSLTRHTLVTRT
jgi:hypothetical protein